MAEVPLTMPKMSMTMEEGTLVEWSVAEGDTIAKDDVVAVVMTDKVDMEVESPVAGRISALKAAEGDVVAVGDPIAMVASEEEDLLGDLFTGDDGADAAQGSAEEAPGAATPAAAGSAPDEASATARDEIRRPPAEHVDGPVPPAVPLARKLAKDHGLDLRDITPTGPHGTVRVKDIKEAVRSEGTPDAASSSAPAPVAESAPDQLLGDARTRRARQLTAAAMEPTAAVPQFTAFRTMDLSIAARARTAVLTGVSWTTLIVRAYAILLREQEQLNGSWAGTGVRRNESVGVVLAVDTPGGLMVPVISDPDQVPLRDLDGEIRTLAAEAKEGRIDPSRLTGGTGTVSNLGSFGVERFNALITPGQATALSVGAVVRQPVFAADGTLEARTACELGLSVDHRTADGADAARALQRLQDLLADPLSLTV